ncbi:MAG: hypothetical protein ABIM99_02195 [Candidatus Dojkabacteria bacterium]
MSILTAEKIFIDQKEEITFVIDRILASDKSKVVFIIPQGALILSSPISIKILFKEVAKLRKSAIVVTEDSYGIYIAEKVGFVVASKVSQISGESWAVAKGRMDTFLEKLLAKKKELSTSVAESNEESDVPLDIQKEVENSDIESVEKDVQIDDNIQATDEEVSEESNEKIAELEAAAPVVEDVLKNYKKPRPEAKVIDLDGIEMMGGGDIRKYTKPQSSYAKIEADLETEPQTMQNTESKRVINSSPRTKFTGKDFTRMVNPESSFTSFFSNLFNRNKRMSLDDSPETSLARAKRKKMLMIGGGIVAAIILVILYLLIFEFSNVEVRLKFKREDVPIAGQVDTNPNITEINAETSPIQIPAQVLLVEKVSGSWTGAATGEGKKGDKAKGFLDIYNIKVQQTINLPAGTKATSEGSGKVYVLTKAVTLDPATVGPGGVTNAFYVQDVPIEAIEVGADYNVPSSDSSSRFVIEGYNVGDVRGTRVRAIEGGSSITITIPSQENVDKLKADKLEELKKQAESKLRNTIPNGSMLIPETIEYKETNVTSVPAVGAEAPSDKTFSLTVEMSVTGYSVKNDDLRKAGEILITTDQNPVSGSQVVVDNLKLPVIEKVEKNAIGYTLSISSQGSVGVRVSEEEIRSQIQGRSVAEVKQYFDKDLEELTEGRIFFSPGFIPEFLQRVPSVPSRVSVKIN